jgi:hypothetical protein
MVNMHEQPLPLQFGQESKRPKHGMVSGVRAGKAYSL